MRPTSVRSGLVTVALLLVALAGWFYLAPTRLGGSDNYVVTSGVSMEPRLHTGDLAIVRAADRYRVGQVVAYRSFTLNEVVLHRIVARRGDRYVFKGDHNNFFDPEQPTRAQLIGVLWIHVPRLGRAVALLHTPVAAAAITAVVAMLLLFGVAEKRKRRRRRQNGLTRANREGLPSMSARIGAAAGRVGVRPALVVAAAAAVAFAGLGAFAFTRPPRMAGGPAISYTQRVSFGYGATVPRSLVYPRGIVQTGDPIFLSIVHQPRISIDYQLTATAPHAVTGTEEVFLRLNGGGGWSRSIRVVAPRRFTSDHARAQVTLNIPSVQALVARVGALTGVSAGGFTMAIVPEIHVSGTLANRPFKAGFSPALSFQVAGPQLQPIGQSSGSDPGAGDPAPSASALTHTRTGTVPSGSSVASSLSVAGASFQVSLLRWLALAGFLLAAGSAVVLRWRLAVGGPFDETARIQAQYGHLIVPIVATADALSWAPFEVSDIKALVRLAEAGDRLILHHRDEDEDIYLVNDDNTVYRHRVRNNRVRWNEWAPVEDAVAPGDEVAQAGAALAAAAAQAADAEAAPGETAAPPADAAEPGAGVQGH